MNIRSIRIGTRLLVLSLMVVAGFAVLIFQTMARFGDIEINGPLYRLIVQGKDVVADVLPPPRYIIESYLTALRMLHENDAARLKELKATLARLEDEFRQRGEFWRKDLAPDHPSHDALLDSSDMAAIQFFEVLHLRYLPALESGRIDEAIEIAYRGELFQKYEAHRKGVDIVVRTAGDRNLELETQAKEMTTRITFIVLIISLFIGILVASATLLIARSIRQPLVVLRDLVSDMASGKADLDTRLPEGHDETGELARNFNGFLELFSRSLHNLAGVGGQIDLHTLNMENAMSRGVQPALARSRASVEEIGLSTSGSTQALDDLDSGISALGTGMNQVLEGIASQQSGVVSAWEEMKALSQSARDASEMAIQFRASAGQLLEGSRASAAASLEIQDRVGRINEFSQAILGVLDVINGIRDRTALLSMNASIEAAHAGEYGEGFSVVAGEIRKLAAHTGENIAEITASVAGIRKEISDAMGLASGLAAHAQSAMSEAGKVRSDSDGLEALMTSQSKAASDQHRSMENLRSESRGMYLAGQTMATLMTTSLESLAGLRTAMDSSRQSVGSHSLQMAELEESLGLISREFTEIKDEVGELGKELGALGLGDRSGH